MVVEVGKEGRIHSVALADRFCQAPGIIVGLHRQSLSIHADTPSLDLSVIISQSAGKPVWQLWHVKCASLS